MLPTGTVTFLFSDIESSSRLWEQQPESMSAEIAGHDALLAEAITQVGGHVVKWTGDGVLAAFADAEAAVAAAVTAQRALEAGVGVVRARMGIHTGRAEPDGDDYHGPTLNRAARIMSLAHGGQVLVSAAVAALVSDVKGVELRDLGRHPLRDLVHPEQIHQLVAAGLRQSFPPISAASAVPESRSSFVGREEAVATIAESVEVHRLVTLTGVGGVGKTRLALETARSLAGRFDRIGVVELAPVADTTGVLGTVAAAMRVPLGSDFGAAPAADVAIALVAHLGDRRNLIVLDNCEHLLDTCAELAETILNSCTATHIIATSREALEVDGEHPFRVPSLEHPDALALFKERTGPTRAAAIVDPQEENAIDDICRRLDGIPLAIELAASRMSHLSAQEIAARLDNRFRLLVGGGRRRVQRQQTLQATLDWSHDLLDAYEQVVLRRLAVFVGGCDLAAAEAICGENVDTAVIDVLASLVAKSLVVVDTSTSPTRYRLLETVRLYAQDKLVASEEADAIRSMHRDHYLAWGEFFEPWAHQFDGTTLAIVRAEHDNLRAALDWSAAEADHQQMTRLARVLLVLWWEDAEMVEAEFWMGRINDEELHGELAACCIAMRGFVGVLTVQRPDLWSALGERAVALSDGQGWAATVGWLVAAMGHGLQGTDDAIAAFDAGIAAADAAGLSTWAASHVAQRAAFRLVAGDIEGGVRDAEMLSPDEGMSWLVRAVAWHIVGDHAAAYAAVRSPVADPSGRFLGATTEVMLAITAAASGEIGAARQDLARGARDALSETVPSVALPTWLLGLAVVAAFEGDVERAGRLLGSIDRPPGWRRSFVTSMLPLFTHYRTSVRDAVGDEMARRLRDEGRAIRRLTMLEQEIAASKFVLP